MAFVGCSCPVESLPTDVVTLRANISVLFGGGPWSDHYAVKDQMWDYVKAKYHVGQDDLGCRRFFGELFHRGLLCGKLQLHLHRRVDNLGLQLSDDVIKSLSVDLGPSGAWMWQCDADRERLFKLRTVTMFSVIFDVAGCGRAESLTDRQCDSRVPKRRHVEEGFKSFGGSHWGAETDYFPTGMIHCTGLNC